MSPIVAGLSMTCCRARHRWDISARAKTACFRQVRASVPERVPDLAAVLSQQPGHEQGELERDVKDDTIGQHAEPPATEGILAGTSCTGAPRLPGDLQSYPRLPA